MAAVSVYDMFSGRRPFHQNAVSLKQFFELLPVRGMLPGLVEGTVDREDVSIPVRPGNNLILPLVVNPKITSFPPHLDRGEPVFPADFAIQSKPDISVVFFAHMQLASCRCVDAVDDDMGVNVRLVCMSREQHLVTMQHRIPGHKLFRHFHCFLGCDFLGLE